MPKLMFDTCSRAEVILRNEKMTRGIGLRPETRTGLLAILLHWIKDQLVGEVPQGDAICEFDCPRTQCSRAEWAACERRVVHAKGELWPGADRAKKCDREPD